MNAIFMWAIALALLSGAAYGQVPSTNDTSDQYFNTGMGTNTLFSVAPTSTNCEVDSGSCDTASGYETLYSNATGAANTASGYEALANNTGGNSNTASGYEALRHNRTGGFNTASGYQALYTNTTGAVNTAFGNSALWSNKTGFNNTASGSNALHSNTGGNDNSAYGVSALYFNTTGNSNSAYGISALAHNTIGSNNTAFGDEALNANMTGSSNTAFGDLALYNTTGTQNIALGYQAGYRLTTGSNHIDIGNPGVAGDNNTIEIGVQGIQTLTHIAGIYGNTSVSGLAVVVDSTGQLGTVSSSERFKIGIVPMGSNTAKLEQLHPVTFHYKADPTATVRYGLIAEEVATVYPELVVRDRDGRIDGVRYDELAPMLLNEMQIEHATVATLVAQHEADAVKIASLERQLDGIQAALVKLQSKDQLVAQR